MAALTCATIVKMVNALVIFEMIGVGLSLGLFPVLYYGCFGCFGGTLVYIVALGVMLYVQTKIWDGTLTEQEFNREVSEYFHRSLQQSALAECDTGTVRGRSCRCIC